MKFSFKNQAKSGRGPDRKIMVVSGCVLVLIGIVAAALYLAGGLSQTKSAQSASSGSEPTDLAPHQGNSSTDSARVPVTKASDTKLPDNKELAVAASVPTAEGLITRLQSLVVGKDALTRESASQLNQIFKDLVGQGSLAVPAIRDFLRRNEDLPFEDLKGGNLANYRSMRTGLIDALRQISGPEAVDVTLETLKSTADPWEVAILSRNLEQQAPGQYRQEAVSAARESLAQGLDGALGERDVGPLFQVLQSYGDASVIADLQKAFPQWAYYASLTLANLPDGEGIPALISQLDDPTAVSTGQSDIAIQVLAQASSANEQAGAALLTLARENKIGEAAWVAVAHALAGNDFEMGTPLVEERTGPRAPKPATAKVDESGELLFTTPSSASWLGDQIDSRLALIDQLIAANQNPAATKALQDARQSLTQKATELSMLLR